MVVLMSAGPPPNPFQENAIPSSNAADAFRITYPRGAVTRLTEDPASHATCIAAQ